MVELIHDLDPQRIRDNLEAVREVAGPGPEILVATKYVPEAEMGALVEAGVELVGENRLQDLEAKQERWHDSFRWDFIGALQSRKVKKLLPRCSRIHSVASHSALAKLGGVEGSTAEILLQVNVSGEEAKSGFRPAELGEAIATCPLPVVGLMTMPPQTEDSQSSRPYFARLAELAGEHGLSQLSMGTSQDWQVAVEEGATVIRLGASLLR